MRVKSLLIYGMAVSMVWGAVLKSEIAVVRVGDINGDQSINILDAQVMVAKVLKGGTSEEKAKVDVNHDGRVDILDLQYILAHLNDVAPQKENPLPPDSQTPKAVLIIVDRSWARIEAGVVSVLPFLEDAVAFSQPIRAEVVLAPSRQMERYLFTLTPNAPPFLA